MSTKLVVVRLAILLALFFGAFSAGAQQTTSPSNVDPSAQNPSTNTQDVPKADTPAQAAPKQDSNSASAAQGQTNTGASGSSNSNSGNGNNQGKVAGTSNDRLFYALPNFLTLENGSKVPPLTAKEKFKVVALGTFDPVNYAWWGFLSAISQAEDSEPQFGQGWVAYAKRYGTTAGDSITENFMVGAVFPSILHQDPRFYQSNKGGFGRRTWYAATRIVVTRGDSGRKEFNFSEVFGSALAAAVSDYSYHPRSAYISTPSNPHKFIGSDRTLANTADVWGTQIALDTITLVVKEFWPDVHRKLTKKRAASTPTP